MLKIQKCSYLVFILKYFQFKNIDNIFNLCYNRLIHSNTKASDECKCTILCVGQTENKLCALKKQNIKLNLNYLRQLLQIAIIRFVKNASKNG